MYAARVIHPETRNNLNQTGVDFLIRHVFNTRDFEYCRGRLTRRLL